MRSRARRERRVVSRSGATANVTDDVIEIRDAEGALIIRYDAERGETTISAPKDLILSGERVIIRGAEASIEVGKLEVTAARLVERVFEAYRDVDSLLQTRAGRMRTLVRGALDLLSGSTNIVSEEDTSIDGKRVLLG
jgi:hypothetical protein